MAPSVTMGTWNLPVFLNASATHTLGMGGQEAAGVGPGHPVGVVHAGGHLEDVRTYSWSGLGDADALGSRSMPPSSNSVPEIADFE